MIKDIRRGNNYHLPSPTFPKDETFLYIKKVGNT